MFVDNDKFLKDISTQMVAVPDFIKLQGRKNINAVGIVPELQSLNSMSLNSSLTLQYLKDYLKQFQVELMKQPFSVEKGTNEAGKPDSGVNYWSVIPGRKVHNLECFVIAFDPSILLVLPRKLLRRGCYGYLPRRSPDELQ